MEHPTHGSTYMRPCESLDEFQCMKGMSNDVSYPPTISELKGMKQRMYLNGLSKVTTEMN